VLLNCVLLEIDGLLVLKPGTGMIVVSQLDLLSLLNLLWCRLWALIICRWSYMECYSLCLLAALTALVSNKYDVYAI
jgi:hypothetical protein